VAPNPAMGAGAWAAIEARAGTACALRVP